ncbi:Fc receptor-like protein 5 [Odontesthes bonariensis]
MGRTLLRVLGFFLISTVFYGNAEELKIKPTLTADRNITPAGGSVTLTCSVKDPAGLSYDLWRRTSSGDQHTQVNDIDGVFSVTEGGKYVCRGFKRETNLVTSKSDAVIINQTVSTVSIKATVILQPSWAQIYSSENVSLRCEIQGADYRGWEYEWRPTNTNAPTSSEYRIVAAESNSREYSCRGRRDYLLTEWSEGFTLKVSSSKPRATLTAEITTIPAGGSVTLTCSVDDPDGWRFDWFRGGSAYSAAQPIRNNGYKDLTVSQGGVYHCRGGRGGGRGEPGFYSEVSSDVTIEETHKYGVILVSPVHPVTEGGSVSLSCRRRGQNTLSNVFFYHNDTLLQSDSRGELNISAVSQSDEGFYKCEHSGKVSPKSWISVKDLTCIRSIRPQNTSQSSATDREYSSPRYGRDEPQECAVYSDVKTGAAARETRKVSDLRMGRALLSELKFFFSAFIAVLCTLLCNGRAQDAVLTIQPNWMTFFLGESVTFTCDIKEGEYTDWVYKILKDGRDFTHFHPNKHYTLMLQHTSYSGGFQCCGLRRGSDSPKCSQTVSISVSEYRPRAKLTAGTTTTSVGGSVTLSCSVESSGGWKYEWFRRTSDTSEVRINNEQNNVIWVSKGGVYRCTGLRGAPAFYTYISDDVTIWITLSNQVVATQQPSWPHLFSGDTITLTCEVQGAGATEWVYTWIRSLTVQVTHNKNWTFKASDTSSGDYTCQCRRRDDRYSSTKMSQAISLSVSHKPRPVLTVSPSWLSPGASVTLSCQVEHPSAGWRFYWYKAVPDPSESSYSYELLPDTNCSADASTIILGQTHTAGYVCRAGRVDRVYYTYHSEPKFVWSGDSRPAASLTVHPDRVQHFADDSVSLTCEGNSTEWTVRRFPVGGVLSRCSGWGETNGSTCIVQSLWHTHAVYWCESGSAFSNAVNITAQSDDVILVTPARPVREGDSVTIGCKLRKKNLLSDVFFYKNEKLVQNDTREEMIIAPVSESDEGFYRCQYSGKESLQTWMAVNSFRPESSSFLVLLVVGLVCGVLLNIFLLLLCLYKQPKDSCFIRSPSTNQSSAAEHNKHPSPVHGDACVYESVRDLENVENDAVSTITDESGDVTYSSVELKTITKRGKNKKPEENTVYSELKMESSTDDSLLYAQVLHHKKETGTSVPAADEMIHSDVNPGRLLINKEICMKKN